MIGSGATAVTLVPAMADTAASVTMLQRSPTYVLSLPARDPLARRLSWLPARVRYPIVRWKAILVAIAAYQLSQRRPALVKKVIRGAALKQLPPEVDVDTHFKPRYDPWDQRLCFVPDGDLFRSLRHGTASVVTGTIDTFTETGVRLHSGEELEADLVVTATGLNLKPFGAIALTVDGAKVDYGDTMAYKALMLSGVPNFAFTIGYTNASWTLKADLVADYVCRLLAHLDEHGHREVARRPRPRRTPHPVHAAGVGLHPAVAGPPAPAGRSRSVAAAPELPVRRPLDPPGPDRRRCAVVHITPVWTGGDSHSGHATR